MTRLWTCSPVARPIGSTAPAMRACPSTSSGLVGSSIQNGSNRLSSSVRPICFVDVPDLICVHQQEAFVPDLLAEIAARRKSSDGSRPTFIFTWVQPSATAFRHRCLTFSSS